MSDKEFVLSIYPEAIINIEGYGDGHRCYSTKNGGKLTWYYHHDDTSSWSEASKRIKEKIERKLSE